MRTAAGNRWWLVALAFFVFTVTSLSAYRTQVGNKANRWDLWFKAEWSSFLRYHPNAVKGYTFINQLRDLCEVKVNQSGCGEGESKYQKSIVLDTAEIYGKQLFLDCMPQSSEADEFIYHEALTHPALIAHPDPKRVFIAGGGEGGTAREILRYPGVEEVLMVDLDPALVEVSEKHLPYWAGVKADKRFTLIEGDAIAFMKRIVENKEKKFDIVIFDLPDAVKATAWLYSSDIFKLAKQIMNQDAVFGTHSGGNVCIPTDEELTGYPGEPCNFMPRMFNTFRSVWKSASIAVSPMPLWQEFHGFMFATDAVTPHNISGRDVDHRLHSRLVGEGKETHPNLAGKLRYYSGHTHAGMFHMQRFYKNFLKTVKEILLPEVINSTFKNSEANDEGLSEMKVCRCDPTKCIFHNGVKGPLMRESDVYETDGDDIAVDPNDPNKIPHRVISPAPDAGEAAGAASKVEHATPDDTRKPSGSKSEEL